MSIKKKYLPFIFSTFLFCFIFSNQSYAQNTSVKDSLNYFDLKIKEKEIEIDYLNLKNELVEAISEIKRRESGVEKLESQFEFLMIIVSIILLFISIAQGYMSWSANNRISRDQDRILKMSDALQERLDVQARGQSEFKAKGDKLLNDLMKSAEDYIRVNRNAKPNEVKNFIKEDADINQVIDEALRDVFIKEHLEKMYIEFENKNWIGTRAEIQSLLSYDQKNFSQLSHEVFYILGYCEVQLNDLDSAIIRFKNSLKINPNYCKSMYGLEYCLEKKGKPKEVEVRKIKARIENAGCIKNVENPFKK